METSELAQRSANDEELVNTYTTQPAMLPAAVRARIESVAGDETIVAYAMADLDRFMMLSQTWVAVTAVRIVITRDDDEGAVTTIPRDRLNGLHETPGLSCTVLTLKGDSDGEPLAVLRYTHRQRRSMENLKVILEQSSAGHAPEAGEADRFYAAAVARPVRDAQASISSNRLAVLWRLISYLRPYRGKMAIGMLGASVMTLLSLVPPFLTKRLVDDVIQPFASGAMTLEQARSVGWLIVATLIVVYMLREAAQWVRLRVMAFIGEFVARDLRREIYAHLQRLSVSFYSRKHTGSIVSRVINDSDRLWDFVAFGVVEVSLSLIMLIGLGAVLLTLDWRLGLVMVLPVPLMIYAFLVHSKTLNRLFLRAWRKWSGLTEVVSDTVPGVRVVKAFNQEGREARRFDARNEDALSEFNHLHVVWTRFWPMVVLALHAMVVGVWVLALPRLLPDGSADHVGLSVGTFLAFLLYMGMFFHPIETIGLMTRMMNRATSSAVRIFEILDTEPEIQDVADAVKLDEIKGSVEFENVSFSYDGVRQVLDRLSFRVEAGEMIGLVGPSGSGKSTIIQLIARFYEPSAGRIRIDGVELRQLDSGHFRRRIGMVLQDPHLFRGTIRENIAYGVPETALEQVIEAARAANSHDFICSLPHGYDTMVGERGHTLSGGERQRVSIARAILNDPRILILDEATSSVDTDTERKIQVALDRLIAGRTVIAIAHRLSTLRRASRLLVIDSGRLTEVGTHAELLALHDGVYRKLHDQQQELHESHVV